jgi:magnesium transporter
VSYEILAQAVRTTGDLESLEGLVRHQHPADIAHVLRELEPSVAWRMLDLLPLPRQAEVFGYLDPATQVRLAHAVPRAKLAALVTEMHADERADLYNKMSDDQREALLPALAQAEREDIRRLAAYAEGTVGAIMTSDYALLGQSLTAREAIEHLRNQAQDKETIYRAYVVDDQRRLIGSLRLEDLILAPAGQRVGEIMERHTHAVRVDDDQEDAARQLARYDLLALPVVDGDGRLVGILTHDDALDVLQEEATEDFHRVGSVGHIVGGLREASFRTLYQKRAPWLILLVFANIFSGAGIAYFEDTIAAYVALVFFLPLLIDSSGNAGSQSATLMVRALATGEVVLRDWGKMLGRELGVAVLLGITMAVAVSFLGVFRGGPEIAVVVALTMVIVVIVGSLVGMSLPFALSRFNLDPATASAPLVTSIADAAGVIIYFAIATAFLLP